MLGGAGGGAETKEKLTIGLSIALAYGGPSIGFSAFELVAHIRRSGRVGRRTVRTISENSRTLKFDRYAFEEE